MQSYTIFDFGTTTSLCSCSCHQLLGLVLLCSCSFQNIWDLSPLCSCSAGVFARKAWCGIVFLEKSDFSHVEIFFRIAIALCFFFSQQIPVGVYSFSEGPILKVFLLLKDPLNILRMFLNIWPRKVHILNIFEDPQCLRSSCLA